MTMITNKHLKNMPSGNRACSAARKWFKATFPDDYKSGVDMRTAWVVLKTHTAEEQRLDWLIWFGCNQLDGEKREAFSWFAAGLAMRYAGIAEYADNVTAENWEEAADAADAAAYAAADAADAAADAKAEMVERIELLLF